MSRLSNALARAVDRHASEIILFTYSLPFFIGYWVTRDQLIGTLTVMMVGGGIALIKKQSGAQTNVGNIEKATVNTEQQEKP